MEHAGNIYHGQLTALAGQQPCSIVVVSDTDSPPRRRPPPASSTIRDRDGGAALHHRWSIAAHSRRAKYQIGRWSMPATFTMDS
jgi:hypothetical protein